MAEPHLHLLRGDDSFAVSLQLKHIQEALGPDFDPVMNASRLDGKTASLDEIRTAVATLPFFGSSRLVVIDSPLGKLDKARQEAFTFMLASVPPTTHLVLIMEDHQKWRKDGGEWVRLWETLTPSHWLIKWFTSNPLAEIIDAALPDARQMPAWITTEARRQGGKLDGAAAAELAQATGTDTSIAGQEITKLLTYVNYQRPVTRDDVLELVSSEGSTDVFVMLDRLMDGNNREAQAIMHRLLDDSQPEVILGAVAHRFRQLLMISDALDEEGNLLEVSRSLGISPNKMGNYTQAARRLGRAKLEKAFEHLLEMDLQAKTSQVDLATNLEIFVASYEK